MKPAPKKCPICGRAPKVEAPVHRDLYWWAACSSDELGSSHGVNAWAHSEAEAVARWNRLVGGRRRRKQNL